jgi:uncharacterized protein
VSPERVVDLLAHECLQLLSQQPVGRIGISVGALPVILPVNFVVRDGHIRFRTVEGTKLAAATRHAVVAFEIDSYEIDGSAGWSVLVQGVASEVTDEEVRNDVMAAIPRPWGSGDDARRIVEINIQSISGRRFHAD